MTRTYEIARPHPISLQRVDFVATKFERINFGGADDLAIPEFIIESSEPNIDFENLFFTLAIHIKTKNNRSKSNKNAFRLTLDVFVIYDCLEFAQSKEALEQFSSADTPVLIVWPYIRSYVSDIVARSGLPDFHIPLYQIRTVKQVKNDHSTKEGE